MAELQKTHLSVGDKAPSFSCEDQDGIVHSLSDYKNDKLIIFSYPKDNTPGCTAEACNLRDNYTSLKKDGYKILGVSADSQKRHQGFKEKYDLPFPLLADTDHQMLKAFGVWGPKKFMGRIYNGILRNTFVIERGVITKIIEKVKTKDHTAQILDE